MECNNEKCELKKEIQSINDNAEKFQRRTIREINDFKKEVVSSIKDIDTRHNVARERVAVELRGEFQRGLMAANAKTDDVIKTTNDHLIAISADLGEIKGALGLKAENDNLSVDNKIGKLNNKILYIVITILTSASMLFLGRWLST